MFRFRVTRLSTIAAGLSAAGAATLSSRPAEASWNPFASKPKIQIHYFNIQGPAEPARLALVIGGIPFDDVRLDRATMLKLKEAGELPWGQLPFMMVDDKKIAQSGAIGMFCARLAGLVPSDSFEQAKVDEIVQFISQDVRERVISPTMREPDAAKKKEMRKKCHEETLPAKFAMLEARVGPSGFLAGDKLTMADVHFYVLANWIGKGNSTALPRIASSPIPS